MKQLAPITSSTRLNALACSSSVGRVVVMTCVYGAVQTGELTLAGLH